jgi:DNA topoisomerase VI subunit A
MATRRKKHGGGAPGDGSPLKDVALRSIVEVAREVYDRAREGALPDLTMPQRNLQNVAFDPRAGYFEMKGNVKTRTLDVNSVKTFAQTLRLMSLPSGKPTT